MELQQQQKCIREIRTQEEGFSIIITSITSTKVVGIFAGRLLDNSGVWPGFKTVTSGVFSVTIYPSFYLTGKTSLNIVFIPSIK